MSEKPPKMVFRERTVFDKLNDIVKETNVPFSVKILPYEIMLIFRKDVTEEQKALVQANFEEKFPTYKKGGI